MIFLGILGSHKALKIKYFLKNASKRIEKHYILIANQLFLTAKHINDISLGIGYWNVILCFLYKSITAAYI